MAQALLRRRKIKASYTPIDYIKFDGTTNSVFDTGISAGNKRVSVTFDLDGSTSTYGGIFGLNGSYPKSYIKLKYGGSGQFSTSTGSSTTTFTVQYSDYGKHTFISNINGKNTFDGEDVTNFNPYTTSYTYCFGRTYISTTSYYKGKIYEIKITDNTNDNVLLWCTPVRYNKGSVTKYGFWDSVSNTFITRTGWTGGNDVVELVSWAKGTPTQIAAMLQAHDDGIINIYNYWNVGDERIEHLNAITANPNGAFLYNIAAQDVVMVLMNEGYEGQTGIHYVVGQKDCLAVYDATDDAAIKYTTGNTYSTWGHTKVRDDIQNLYYNAFASADFKALFKDFTTTFINRDKTALLTSTDKFALFAEKEIFGASATNSYAIEQAALTQIEYYETAANRIKLNDAWTQGTGGYWWYTRSLSTTAFHVVCVQSDGISGTKSYTGKYPSIAPFGCI